MHYKLLHISNILQHSACVGIKAKKVDSIMQAIETNKELMNEEVSGFSQMSSINTSNNPESDLAPSPSDIQSTGNSPVISTHTTHDNLEYICFHGSPGKASDFDRISREIPNFRFKSLARKYYPDYNALQYYNAASCESSLLGYSWGCREALDYYVKHTDTIKSITLISPYILHSVRATFLNKYILSTPVALRIISRFHTFIINHSRQSPKIKLAFLSNKTSPLWSKLSLNICSFCERKLRQATSYASILRMLRDSGTPIHLIIRDGGNFDYVNKSIRMIKSIVPQTKIYFIENIQSDALQTQYAEIAAILRLINRIDNSSVPSVYNYTTHTASATRYRTGA